MGMIRRADLGEHTRDAYVMDLGDLEKRGNALVEAANSKATQIVRDARAERERLIGNASEEGRKAGHSEGYQAGLEQGRAEGLEQARDEHCQRLEELAAMWGEQLVAFEQQRDSMLEAARVQVVELAACIARRVVRRVVQMDPGVVVRELESVLSSVTEPTRLVISVHPDDAELTRAELPKLIDRFASCEHAQVVTDPALCRGSCVARTPGGGVIDASLTTQIDRIVESLLPSGHVAEGALRLPDSEPGDADGVDAGGHGDSDADQEDAA